MGCMDIGNIAEWVGFGLSLITAICTAITWVRSNLTKAAKAEAEAAAQRAKEETQVAKELAQAAQEQAAEAKRQSESMQKLVESLKEQVAAAERSAQEAARLATATEESNKVAEGHLAELRRMADALRGPEFTLELSGKNRYVLSYSGDVPVEVSVLNFDKFLRADGLGESFEMQPNQSLSFLAFGSWGRPVPDELVLDVQGRDEPVRLVMARSS